MKRRVENWREVIAVIIGLVSAIVILIGVKVLKERIIEKEGVVIEWQER